MNVRTAMVGVTSCQMLPKGHIRTGLLNKKVSGNLQEISSHGSASNSGLGSEWAVRKSETFPMNVTMRGKERD